LFLFCSLSLSLHKPSRRRKQPSSPLLCHRYFIHPFTDRPALQSHKHEHERACARTVRSRPMQLRPDNPLKSSLFSFSLFPFTSTNLSAECVAAFHSIKHRESRGQDKVRSGRVDSDERTQRKSRTEKRDLPSLSASLFDASTESTVQRDRQTEGRAQVPAHLTSHILSISSSVFPKFCSFLSASFPPCLPQSIPRRVGGWKANQSMRSKTCLRELS